VSFQTGVRTGDGQVVVSYNVPQTAPTITAQPANQTVTAGDTASFNAAAGGNPAPTVQWQVSTDSGATFTNISGATAATLSFTALAGDSGKQYRAVFSNSEGSAASSAATLTVNTPPAITLQPADQTVNVGQSVSFRASASGSPPPTINWQVSTNGGVSWTGFSANNVPTLTLTAESRFNGWLFRAVFSNAAGTATTQYSKIVCHKQKSELLRLRKISRNL
jgi:hypothetical protein